MFQGHLLCRVPFTRRGKEIHAGLEYTMKPKSSREGGGQGLCVYLVDPSVPGWDRDFNGTGPLGFVGKHGAIVGVGIDCTGNFCEGQPGSIAVKRANDAQLLCEPVVIKQNQCKGGVVTRKGDYWRKVHIKFDIELNTCEVRYDGKIIIENVQLEGIEIPKTVCIGVCAATSDGKSNFTSVNKVKIRGHDFD